MKKIIIIISALLIVGLSYNVFMNYKFHEKTKQLNDLINSNIDKTLTLSDEMTTGEINYQTAEFTRKSDELVKEAENYKSKWLFRMW
jgi:uncharacterized protein YxeA